MFSFFKCGKNQSSLTLFLQASDKLDQFEVDRNGVTRNLQHNYIEENVIDLDEVSGSEGRL